ETYLESHFLAATLIAERDSLEEGLNYLQGVTITSTEGEKRRLVTQAELQLLYKQTEAAVASYTLALESAPKDKDILYARAMVYEKLDRIDLLESDLLRVLQFYPDNSTALNALGYTLADRTDRYDEALQYIEKALKQHPDDAAILDSMGWVLYKMGRYNESLPYLNRANSLREDGEIAAHYGELLWVSGDEEKAREVWAKAKEFAPDHEILVRTLKRFLP
ncbi:MAG: tetratricopeptide repeat protein, partial [Gammaproteobacteria bacterium]|nr:tetratricopeptide repeat protein [Gammaproteobacteria bacterium]